MPDIFHHWKWARKLGYPIRACAYVDLVLDWNRRHDEFTPAQLGRIYSRYGILGLELVVLHGFLDQLWVNPSLSYHDQLELLVQLSKILDSKLNEFIEFHSRHILDRLDPHLPQIISHIEHHWWTWFCRIQNGLLRPFRALLGIPSSNKHGIYLKK